MSVFLRFHLIALSIIATLLVAGAPDARAEAAQNKSPLGIAAPAQQAKAANEAPPSMFSNRQRVPAAQPTLTQRWWGWLLEKQRNVNRSMANAVKRIKSENPLTAALGLILLAFAYGVLHAAGPGHGKAVISAYVLANEETVRRGITLSFLSAFFQAVSAIVFVGALAILLNQTSIQMRATENIIQSLSWALVAAIGFWLLWQQVRLYLRTKSAAAASHHHAHHESEHHTHDHHEHGPDCGCGHNHMPSPASLQGEWSWKKALPVALSVGIRPCTGALLLLVFSLTQGMLWAGIIGTFAMSLGTALTVSVLASLAVGSRNFAAAATGANSIWAHRIQMTAGFAGATLVLLMGVVFFFASLQQQGTSPL